jgi:hypothetical protein
MRGHGIGAAVVLTLFAATWPVESRGASPPQAVALARDGRALLPLLGPAALADRAELAAAVDDLRVTLARVTGATFEVRAATPGATGIYLGRPADFPWLGIADELGAEGVFLHSGAEGVLLLGHPGHAVSSFLHHLGCRWFFPGNAWEVVPREPALTVKLSRRENPAFPIQRRIWYGFGAYPKCRADKSAWDKRNRLGGSVRVGIGHTWHGLAPERDFKAHPEWFALVDGERKPSKPCYSHPEVVARAVAHAKAAAKGGRSMVSMTPPDGLGYCACQRCLSAAGVKQTVWRKGSLFGTRADGAEVNVTSETLFALVRRVAEELEAEHPGVMVGCYAYSAYSHPPSFTLPPNVLLQTTTAYRRTPLSLDEQLAAFRTIGVKAGIRGYWDVYQWSYDRPELMRFDPRRAGAAPTPGPMTPASIRAAIKRYAAAGVESVNAEMSNNWGARGLVYYIGARLLWNPDEDLGALLRDFYVKAFGPAARPMERYYARWYGPSAVVLDPDRAPPPARLGQASLAAAYRDLDEAVRLTATRPDYRARVDQIRLYAHYLRLRLETEHAAQAGERQAVVKAVRAETVFGARLLNTNMIHTRPLIGKAFQRRFRHVLKHLKGLPEAEGKSPRGFRSVREDVPDADELERLWAEDERALKVKEGKESP